MLTQYMSIILPALIGAVSAILVNLFSNVVYPLIMQQRTSKEEKKKQLEQKVNEAHRLISQIKIWYVVTFRETYEEVEALEYSVKPIYENIAFWFADTTNKQVWCPIEELETVIRVDIFAIYPLFHTLLYYVHNLQNLREALKSDYIEERCERLVNAFITNLETQKLLHEKSLVLELDKETETFFRLIILDRSYDSVDRINQHLSLLNDVSTEDETIVLWGKIAGYLCCLAENFVTVYNELQYNLEKQIGREGIRNRYGDIAKSIDQLFEKLQ